jgi:uncharacterized integral membrane protein (TIGR00698 family)
MSSTTAAASTPAVTVARPVISEDWLAVLVAAVSIILVLGGVRPLMPAFNWEAGTDVTGRVLSPDNIIRAVQVGLLLLIPAAAGAVVLGARVVRFAAGFSLIYLMAWLSQVIAGNATMSALGLEYVIFALVMGLALRQVLSRLPAWLEDAVRTEYYIKTGLVVLGAGILFHELVEAGALGIAQAIIVVLSVWFFCFWLCKRLRVDDELSTMLCTAVSICGVSAAIAACGAIHGDRKKLSYVTSLVLVVAIPMLVVMPWIARIAGLPEPVAGAWLGGTLDTSAAVVAAGELVSDVARDAAVVVKLSQNALIGVAAFLLTVWWTLRRTPDDAGRNRSDRPQAGLAVIWDRFPKFVIGFMLVSFIFSFALSDLLVRETRGLLNGLRTMWFAIAFVSIGLETSIGGLVSTGEGRPAVAFLGGQAFNIVVTLIVAWLFFGGILFDAPTF